MGLNYYDLFLNLFTEIIGIIITVYWVDKRIKKIERKKIDDEIKPLKKYICGDILTTFWFAHHDIENIKESLTSNNIEESNTILTQIMKYYNELNQKIADNTDIMSVNERTFLSRFINVMDVLCLDIQHGLEDEKKSVSVIVSDVDYNLNNILKYIKKFYKIFSLDFKDETSIVFDMYEGDLKRF